MGKPFWRSVEYFFTGNYSADEGNNDIVAIGFGGNIHAYGGDDHIKLGSIGATIYTGEGNDTVSAGAGYLRVDDTGGNLTVRGAAGYADINKSGDGNISFEGAAGGVDIEHTGRHGAVNYSGAAAYNHLVRKGESGGMTFSGAGGYNRLWHETNDGDLSYSGAGAANKIDRTWFDKYQGSHGNISFYGAGAANSISSRVETGNIFFAGAGVDNHIVRRGKAGDITMRGAGASNRIERTRHAEDVYTETRGDIDFEGVGGYNSLYSDVAHGNIHFTGAGAYNTITRKGAGNEFSSEGLDTAKAENIALTTATMSGSWIGYNQSVTGIKSTTEPNTYLFAFTDKHYTKINKVQLSNDPQTGKLKYYSTAWYKEGNHLENLADKDISSSNGFTAINQNGAYTLSDLTFEHQQPVTIHAVEKDLIENQWVSYGDGTLIDAADVTLADAKMSGHAIYADGTAVDVSAVKSNCKANTYVYAKKLGAHTKIVVVELANDEKTGELKYLAKAWYKTGDHMADLANADISTANGYHEMGTGGYSLSELQYSVNAVRSTSEHVEQMQEYSEQALVESAKVDGESSGDVRFEGAGGGNVINSNVTRGNVYFSGGGIANVIQHSSKFGDTEFIGGGAANVIVKSGELGDLTFRGVGLANVLVHQSQQGKMDVTAGGAVNVLVRVGDGQYLAHLLAYGNISVHKGNGDSQVAMLGGYNTHTQVGNGNATWMAAGGFNVMTQMGNGDIASVLAGGANVLSKIGGGDLIAGMLGGANVITHISGDDESSDTTAVALGGANILTKKGKGDALAVMGGGANVLTHVGDGATTGVMVGGANVLTKVGNGNTTGVMLGIGNVLTHVGDGQTLGVMGAAGNIFTKVGDGTSIAAMVGAGNIFTHVGEGDAWALMGGLGNVFTKVGNGNALALMVAEANVFTHIGDGMSVALMLAKGNIATKVGNGMTLAAMVGNANIFTHVGDGSTFAAMIGQANIMTKVGDELTAALMVGKANIMTHVGNGTSIGMFAGEANIMTKVGDGTTLAAMFGKANIMTHVGDGLTGVLALGEANIVTKVGDDFMGVVAAAKANVVTHVGDATTAAVLAGKGNILTKVGEGTTVGLLLSEVGNVMTHVGDGATIGFAKGKANIITKVGDGLGINAGWGNANVFTHVGDGDRYNFAKGEANVITKVGDGQEVSVVQGKANIVTHVGNGDDYTGAWGQANVITKVGDGRNVVLAKGDASIVTQVGNGDSFNALWSKGNIVTKVGDGMQVTAAKGQANITTTVGNGLSVTAAYGDANINTKVGDGISVNVAWGKFNVNTKVGDGLNVAVMKGKANANIHVGDGLGINASYAQNNVAIKIGNGDFYSLAVASSNTDSNKLSALFDNIKQTVLGVGGSQAINHLVQGDDATASGSRKGKGAIDLAEVSSIDGFNMDEIDEVSTDLGDSLSSSVTDVETPELDLMRSDLNVEDAPDTEQNPNLITNGGFEQGRHGWQSTHGIEADYAANVYGVDSTGHGSRVTELATHTNTTIYQDIQNLADGEVISLSFDFAKREGISADNGIEVIWNGNVVFSTSGDESAWQQKTLKLTAQAGSNRIEFKGTGHNDGLGYILDNVVAKSEMLQHANAVSEHAEQNEAAQNAMGDKERAEADRQRLEQEKEKQLVALSGSQSQLESTDQDALENNGHAHRDAVKDEANAVTEELTAMAQGLDALNNHADYEGKSGNSWREHFAGGILDGVQGQLDNMKDVSDEYLSQVLTAIADNQKNVKEAVAKSEAGVAQGEQNRAGAEQDIADAKADAEARKAEALSQQERAEQAERDAHSASDDAQSRGERDSAAAESKASQAQADAKAAKQNEGDRPEREGAVGSELAGNAYDVQGAGETASHVDAKAQAEADGRFNEDLTEEGLTEEEQEALEAAKEAVNQLQINAGTRSRDAGVTISSMFTQAQTNSIVVPNASGADALGRKSQEISGVNLEALGDVADASGTVMKAVDGFGFLLLDADDTSFIDSTKRHLGKLSTDLPSKELKAVRRNIQYVQRMPSEDNLAALEQALQKWQEKNPNEFAQRSELVKPLQFEIVSLQSHIQASRAKDADVFGIAIDPKAAEAFESKVVFDGIGRVAGLVEPLAEDEISRLQSLEVVSPTQTNSTSEREAAKTESESIVEFVYKLGQVNVAEADVSEISQLAEQAKALWMNGNVTQESAVALFSEAHDKLAAHPELQTLAGKLLSDAQKEKTTGQYLDNLFGRRFDSEIAHELVKTPTEQAINTSVQIGTSLVNDFDEWMHTLLPDAADDALRDGRIQKKMEAFAKAVNKDARPWFSRVPTLTQFLETPNYDNFKTMMMQVDDGFGVIKVPFLAVKMAITPGLGMEMAPWKAEGDRFYQNVITKARSTSAVISTGVDGENQVNLIEKKTSDYGTALHYQPKGDAYEDFQEGRSVADGRILTPGKETTFESNALNNGLSVVTGASGSTNIMMHLNQHLASKNPGFSVDQAYLNTLAFLVFDGGHSVNESLAVYKALQETGDDRKAVLESYTANYQDLVELVGADSEGAVRTALDNAFEKTLEFYKEHAHSASEELVALGGKRQHQRELMNESVAIDNDGTPACDKSSLSPLTRFLNDELYGSKEDRRNTGEITQALLDHAVTKGESDKVTLKGDSGRLTGYFHHGKTAQAGEQDSEASQKVVLFLHGSGSSAEEQASAIRNHYQKQGMDMLAVNMRGYGESDGGPSEKGLYQDARTMFSYLVNDKGIDPSNIIIHGYSMGGPIAADLARYAAQNGKAVSGLLLDRPMPSMTKAITGHEVPNPAGIVGALSKVVNGQFSVEKNLKGLPKETPIMLLTDNEGLGTEGEKMRAKLTVAGYNVTGEQTFYGHEASNRLMSQYAGQIVSGLFDAKSQDGGIEVLKGIKSDLQRYGEALKPDNSKPGKAKDIRATKDFLGGYKQGYADQVVDGFRSDMSINQLVDLLVKGNWTAEQKGALAWEIESRALKVTFQPKVEKFNRLFRDVASAGMADSKASEQLAPQLLLLNLSNDGFGGRCDPLSKLVLVAKQLENDGQAGVAGKLLEKLYSAAAVLSNPDLYSETERANAGKLLGSLAALHAKNPMNETSIKVWQEKLEGKQALTVNGVVDKITDSAADGQPVLLELDAPGHAMAVWAKGSGEDRVYGFYDPNAGVVEFSSADKFGAYLNRFFGKSDLNMAQSYRLAKNEAGEVVFNRVVVMDGSVLATYKPTLGDKTTMQGILDLPVFDSTPMKKPVGTDVVEGAKTPGQEEALAGTSSKANNQDVESWEQVAVTPKADGGETRFDGQVIIQTENDPAAAKAAANLAGKHPESSVVVQLDADGNYRVVYGDPSQLAGKLRWQVVGHGRDESENNNTHLSGYSADELAAKLTEFNKKFNQDFSQAENITSKPEHISIAGCSLVSDDKQEGFARRFVTAMDEQGIRSDVSARSTEVAVDSTGRKHTRDANDQWAHKLTDNKVVLSWNEQGEVVARKEAIRNGIAEGDIDLTRVGQSDSDAPDRGAIADNDDVFTAPEKRKNAQDTASSGSDSKLSYSGNIQVNVGNGEFTAVNWGTSNLGIKVGNGGFKSLAFGDNNVMVHVGNGDSKHSFDMAGYQALEGAQMFIGNRNVSFNMGRSNDLIVMADKSIPTPPMVNPFDGASRISGVLQGIARSGEGQDWLAAQEQQWTLSGAEKFVNDMSGLDQTSSVDYTTLVELDSQNERSSRGLKSDTEAALNKQYNQWLSGNGDTDTSKMSRADKFRQANEKLAFNFAVGGQGADIQVTTGNWNFMFGDNIQSILDTNLGSLFGLMTQQFSATGQAKTTFTYNPEDLPRQLKNKLLGKLAGVGADTTLGDIFGVDYSAGGHIVSRNGEAVDGVAILTEMLEVIGEFSGDQLQSFVDPSKLLDSLESSIDMGAEGIQSFAETHGLKETAPEGEEEKSSVSVNGETVEAAVPERSAAESEADSSEQERAFGFNALNLPNLFATIFSQDKQDEMASLVTNLKENLTADLLNMKEQTFDFLRNSGHLQGDGDINVSLGNYNFNWGGDGKDLGAYLGDNNNFWGGRGDDVYYATGTSNIFTGGEGNDMGVLMGRENMMFGGDGNDTAVVAGRINHVFMGAGNDKSFVFGEGGEINTGTGQDYVVTSGNFNRVDTGDDQDYSVTIGNNNQVELGGGNDFANVFGNNNRVNGSAGNDVVKLMGYHAVLNGGEGDDHLIAAAISKFSQFDGGEGRDLMVLGGYQNTFKGGEDVDSFVVSGDVIDNLVEDIRSEDNIVFNGVNWQNLWFERSGYDLKLSVLRDDSTDTVQDQFESVGAVTFADYFNGNRAELVIGMGEKDAAGEREYTALSDNAVDALVQAMSSFSPTAGDNGFIDNLDSKSRVAVTTAWADVTNGKGAIA
ncbi:MARTX multifunctional-autoprocessing repeats-in-toxin holotoxin RtxA [uncultured Photobacterium sp.]|uniref:MARTX multifunctional-autoprocessing repeats-in-toxin holotoxin RtxA n=1 Tax=uncultured Photobacterium sp. TaxID=173973 RepID=UPI0026233F06|nr:MARTX multifunctional-autoprocessing repeats-in-toxin holotoxin RtxA [uncultured Photobacterium sp.]